MGYNMQQNCCDGFIQIKNEYYFALLCIGLLVTIPYFALQFRGNTDVLKCQDCRKTMKRFAHTKTPDGALGKNIATRKHRALAGCKRQGPVCIWKTINFPSKSLIINEHTSREKFSYITVCVFVCVGVCVCVRESIDLS